MRPYRFLPTVLALLLAVPSFAAITGVVMTPDGKALSGVQVTLLPVESSDAMRLRVLSAEPELKPLAEARTDSKGTFSLTAPKPGVYELRLNAAGYIPQQRSIEHDDEAGAIVMTKGALQEGKISAQGKPVARATVVLHYGSAEYVTRTGEDGRYSVPDAKRADRIIVAHPEYGIDDASSRVGLSREPIVLTRGLTRTEVRGRVVEANGETPVPGARIFIDEWPLATSAEDGSFVVAAAPARWKTITATKDDLRAQQPARAGAAVTLALEKTASISGRVNDASTGKGVPHVSVALAERSGAGGLLFQSSAHTDEKGAFTIHVSPGTYMLLARHPSFEPSNVSVAVTAHERKSQDIAANRLARVSGTVFDESREPVVAAKIAAEYTESRRRFMPIRFDDSAAVSGPDGRFVIRVRPEEQQVLKTIRTGYPEGKSDSFSLTAGERKSGVAITIPTGVAVSGRVTDKDGHPLSDIQVTTTESQLDNRNMVRLIMGGPPADDGSGVRTDGEGNYTLRVKEGSHDFTFSGEGWAPSIVRAQAISHAVPATVDATLTQAVEIRGRVTRKGAGVENVQIRVLASGDAPSATTASDGTFTLSGLTPGMTRVLVRKAEEFVMEQRSLTAPASDVTIELAAGGRVTGRVVDKSSGKPVTQFQAGVSVSRSGGGRVMAGPPQLQSFNSDDGSFTLENVPPGAMTIVAQAPGFAEGRANINVEEGKAVESIELALETALQLTGRVTGPNGAPLKEVSVRTAGADASAMPIMPSEGSRTDASGTYTLGGLTAGEMTVVFSHPDFISVRKSVTLRGRETRLDAQMAAGISVTGRVVSDTGAPLADATVDAMSPSLSGDATRSDQNGRFELRGLEPGRYRITARRSGYSSTTLDDFEIAAGTPITIEMKSGGVLFGRVMGLTAEELVNTVVRATSGRSEASATVDSSGNYRLQGAPIGKVQVVASVQPRVSPQVRSSPAKTVELTPGATQQVDLEFASGFTVQGRVTQNGVPLANASVRFAPYGGVQSSGFIATSTDEQGNYRAPGLEQGSYDVNVFDSRTFSSWSTKYDVRGSNRFDIDYTTTSIKGRVIDVSTGTPLSDATVQLRSTSSESRMNQKTAMSDINGAFVFDGLSEGSYVVSASRTGYGAQPLDVNVGSSGASGIEIALSRSSGMTLRVVDARNGRDVAASAIVLDAQGRVVHDGRLGPFDAGVGEIQLPLSPGRYVASVSSFGLASQTVTLVAPGTQRVELTPGGSLHVISKHAEPLRVRLVDATGAWYPRGPFPSNRSLVRDRPTELPSVAPGTYTLQLIGPDERVMDAKQVIVQEGQITTVEI